jgi:hypothetical protein
VRRIPAIGGMLLAFGATWVVILRAADTSCAAFHEQPGQGCIAPDNTGLYLLGFRAVILGVVLLVVGVLRARG